MGVDYWSTRVYRLNFAEPCSFGRAKSKRNQNRFHLHSFYIGITYLPKPKNSLKKYKTSFKSNLSFCVQYNKFRLLSCQNCKVYKTSTASHNDCLDQRSMLGLTKVPIGYSNQGYVQKPFLTPALLWPTFFTSVISKVKHHCKVCRDLPQRICQSDFI